MNFVRLVCLDSYRLYPTWMDITPLNRTHCQGLWRSHVVCTVSGKLACSGFPESAFANDVCLFTTISLGKRSSVREHDVVRGRDWLWCTKAQVFKLFISWSNYFLAFFLIILSFFCLFSLPFLLYVSKENSAGLKWRETERQGWSRLNRPSGVRGILAQDTKSPLGASVCCLGDATLLLSSIIPVQH